MLHMPTPMLIAGGESSRSYEGFLAHIAARTSSLVVATAGAGTMSGGIRVQMGEGYNPRLYGSPWVNNDWSFSLPLFASQSNLDGVASHALPSSAVYQAQKAASRTLYLIIEEFDATGGFGGILRNDVLSESAESGGASGYRCTECSYWDGVEGGAFTTVPFSRTGPTPYAWS